MNEGQQPITQYTRVSVKTGKPTSFQDVDKGSNPLTRIELKLVTTQNERKIFDRIVKYHHTYKPKTNMVGRRIDWLVKNNGLIVGAIGIGSSVIGMKPRDKFIGWNKNQRLKNLTKTATNWRFCLTQKGIGSQVLKKLIPEAKKEWKKKYGQNLVLLETLVKPPYKGTCYKGAGWTFIGETKGTMFQWVTKEEALKIVEENKNAGISSKKMQFGNKINENTWQIVIPDSKSKKLIFIKPLHRYWKKQLLKEGDEQND